MGGLSTAVVFLGAAVIAVPIFKRLKLGSILGYLIAGIIIGPAALKLVNDPDDILHFAELGVVLLLFVIGLELEPQKLWRMRNHILITGGGQLVFTTIAIMAILVFLMGVSSSSALIIGLALALSSTAFAIQLMNEQLIFKTEPGQRGFSILLMQDIAVIPILLIVESMSSSGQSSGPAWWISVLALLGILLSGKYVVNPFLNLVSRYGSEEIMTAASLLIVMVTAIATENAGLSMGMGAFLAGVLLANSSFKHQLEAEIEPFKGLLLGLFFMAIGMNLNLNLLFDEPVFIVSCAIGLVVLKFLLIFVLMRLSKTSVTDSIKIGLVLSQGGEFAFVIMNYATANGAVAVEAAAQVTIIVGLSMALTAPLVMLYSALAKHSATPNSANEAIEHHEEPEVIIAGMGRFGQITARILAAKHIPFTALDKDTSQIAFVRQFDNKVYFGDATRVDILKAAGIESARIMFLAMDSDKEGLKVAQVVRREFPHVTIIARAYSRFSFMRFNEIGVTHCVREMFESSLQAAELVLRAYGLDEAKSRHIVQVFKHHDEALLDEDVQNSTDMDAFILRNKKGREDLQQLFEKDTNKLL